ncbi:GntR family transcriptional regulator [Quadrisphaera granulorum]|nr:GntR family transcriptional regulator [Quadrisphaera granulorum]
MTPAAPSLLADQVFVTLRDMIVNGHLPGGTRLRIRQIADEVGTSVMPVREAIRRLEEAGLAVSSPHRGAVVREVSKDELLHIYDIRILLETDAAERGARDATPQRVALMAEQLEHLRTAADRGDVDGTLDRDEDLLRVLYGSQPNRHLVELVEGLWRKCRIFKIFGAKTALAVGDDALWAYPARLVEAARRQDGQEAAAATRESLLSARGRIESFMGSTQTASDSPPVEHPA